ncbi:hypothetical protein B0A48_12787 [Cryoendolithus antarcticus]|uniref:Haloacid dehalogenase, type II n=1 Tax=Cryoendolithus antarcticus TaxID=1507870 RepID=A0A1V8SRP7_9PEZI|nr:hypothetical protein B0A48_12787 [Cryoendolithus antarcticus]
MASLPDITLAFDAYGTLLSTASIATHLATHFSQSQAEALAKAWRVYQLEYTWRLNSMGVYEDFERVTRRSFLHALAEAGLELGEKDIEGVMQQYDQLDVFGDVKGCLDGLRGKEGVNAVVFSNGTHSMVSNSVTGSATLRDYGDVLKNIVVVEEVGRFKPAQEVYEYLVGKVGKQAESQEQVGRVWLVSGNPFDVVGARAVGMNVVWVDRGGSGWVDGLVEGEKGKPTAIVKSLEEVVGVLERHYGSEAAR